MNKFNIESRKINKVKRIKALFFLFLIIMIILFYLILYFSLNNHGIGIKTEYIHIGLISLDSLLTGATITLIAFSNMSPGSSSSAHIYKSIYWKTSEVDGTSFLSRILCFLTASFLKPYTVLVSSIFSTGIEAILLIVNKHVDSICVDFTFMLFIFITFLLLISTISRYYLFNKNPARIASLYIYRIINKVKLSEDKFHEFVNLISYLKGTKNKEFLIIIIRRINEIKFDDCGYSENITKSLDVYSEKKATFLGRYLMSFHKNDNDKFRQYKLLILLYRTLNSYNETNNDLFKGYMEFYMKQKNYSIYLMKEPIKTHETENALNIDDFKSKKPPILYGWELSFK